MRWIFLASVLALGACASQQTHELAMVKPSDPVWQLNPGKWQATTNDLTSPPPGAR